MPSEKFLTSVAEYYINSDIDLSELCLVFPNKRAAIFFRRYFKNCAKSLTFVPNIKTIGAFNEMFSQKRLADRVELIFILYSAYCTVMKQKGHVPMEFNKFAFWGDMILSDFDDIDAEMANAESLFTNVLRFNEIRSDYLTDEQRNVIRAIWGAESSAYFKPSNERFWYHIQDDGFDEDGKPSAKFLRLWHILSPLYKEFNGILSTRNLTYPGLLTRETTATILATPRAELPFRRIGFVGFNRINLSQAKLMNYLQENNMADFFWDLLPKEKKYCERAGLQISKLCNHFPMPSIGYESAPYNTDNCKVNVYAIPSNTLQAKAVGNIVRRWNDMCDANGNKIIDTQLPDNTAIVLPDQSMLTPILAALPNNLGNVNITMGLSYRDTPFASLLKAIISLHMNCRYIHQKPHFFFDDITTLIAHPDLRAVALKGCMQIKNHLDKHHQYNVPVEDLYTIIGNDSDLGSQALKCIFRDVHEINNVAEVRTYLTDMISAMRNALEASVSSLNNNAHEVKVIDAYKDGIDKIYSYIDAYHISAVNQGSIFAILEKLLSLCTINMSGTPLIGLQVMGVLETRALDFDNVIIMSMNERVYPKRNRQRSLISQQIRQAYFLPASDAAEQEYSYYFYRLFSRAKRVVCLYDSRANGIGNGAMSRYLLQMNYLNTNNPVRYSSGALIAQTGESRDISIAKSDKVMAELMAFKSSGKDALNISASALKKYRSCKLAFYLQYVKRVRDDNEPTAFMDSATYGSVMHRVLQSLFLEQRANNSNNPVMITKAVLMKMKQSFDYILGRVKNEINALYHEHKYDNRLDHLPTESILLAEIMAEFIIYIIDKEIAELKSDSDYFDFIDAEEKINKPWSVSSKNTINFRMDIDRHDRMSDGIDRFIDYKTGHDKPSFSSIKSLFSPEDSKANDACFQLLTYAAAYSDITGFKGKIKPALYQLIKAAQKDSDFYKNGDRLRMGNKYDKSNPAVDPVVWDTDDPQPWQKEFRERLENMIDEIFDQDVPFSQTRHKDNCKYCKFVQMCARVVPEKD